jgi:hypothetical protein
MQLELGATDQDLTALAAAWELSTLEVPEALRYLMARLEEAAGELMLTNVDPLPVGTRYRYRWRDRQRSLRYLEVVRPAAWNLRQELVALQTVRQALVDMRQRDEAEWDAASDARAA